MAATTSSNMPENLHQNLNEQATQAKQRSSVKINHKSMIKFVRQKDDQQMARVQLLLMNNSKRQVEWKLKCSSEAITAQPMASGLIVAYNQAKCTLIWQRPTEFQSWDDVEPSKILLAVKLIAENGKLVGEANTKFVTEVDQSALCTSDDPPIHKLVLVSEKVDPPREPVKAPEPVPAPEPVLAPVEASLPSAELAMHNHVHTKEEVVTQTHTKTVTRHAHDVNGLADNPTLFWLIALVCCLTTASFFLLKAILGSDRNDEYNQQQKQA